jgi:AcrR family transcriptional regulator
MAFSEMETTTRRYKLKERARRQEETRRRITEATVALHEEVGPAATAISEIARRAGVQRVTVYKHFPDEGSLFAACSAHWTAAHPRPDLDAWREIDDPAQRTRTALRDLYAYYAENSQTLGHVTRDARAIPALREVLDESIGPYLAEVADLLIKPWKLRGGRRDRLVAQLDLVLPFEGWQLLSRRTGGDARKAADLAAALVRAAAS